MLFFDAYGDGKVSGTREYVFTEWGATARDDLAALRSQFDRLCCINQPEAKFSLPLDRVIQRVEFWAFQGP